MSSDKTQLQNQRCSVFLTGRDITTSLFGDSKLSAVSNDDTDDKNNNNDAASSAGGLFAAFEKEDFLGETNQKSLRELMSVFGCKVVEFKVQYDSTLKTTGVYAQFENESGAKSAVEALDGEKFFDFVLNVHSSSFKRFSKPKPIALETNHNNNNAAKKAGDDAEQERMRLFLDSVNFSTTPHALLPSNHLMPASLQMSRKLLDLIQKWLHQHNSNMNNISNNNDNNLNLTATKEDDASTDNNEQHPPQEDIFTKLLEQLNKAQQQVASLGEEHEKVKAAKLRRFDELNAGPSKRLIQKLQSLNSSTSNASNGWSARFCKPAHNPLLLATLERHNRHTYNSSTSSILYFSNIEVKDGVATALTYLVSTEQLPVERWAVAPCVNSIDLEDYNLRYKSAKERIFQKAKNVALIVQFTTEAAAAFFLDKIFTASGNKNFIFEKDVGKIKVRTLVMTFEDAINRGFVRRDVTKEFGVPVPTDDNNNNNNNSNPQDDSNGTIQANAKLDRQRALPAPEVDGLFDSREATDVLRDLRSAGI